MLRCNDTPSILDERVLDEEALLVDEEALDEAGDPLRILMREEEQARLEEEQDRIEEKQARDRERIAKVLIPGDYSVQGLSSIAKKIEESRQWLRYALQKHYQEARFRAAEL